MTHIQYLCRWKLYFATHKSTSTRLKLPQKVPSSFFYGSTDSQLACKEDGWKLSPGAGRMREITSRKVGNWCMHKQIDAPWSTFRDQHRHLPVILLIQVWVDPFQLLGLHWDKETYYSMSRIHLLGEFQTLKRVHGMPKEVPIHHNI